jgi:hypothetical protein
MEIGGLSNTFLASRFGPISWERTTMTLRKQNWERSASRSETFPIVQKIQMSVSRNFLKKATSIGIRLPPVLAEEEEKYGAIQLNEKLTEQWSQFWGNFITSQETFVSTFLQFLRENGETLRLVDIDTAASFLKGLDPTIELSEVLDRKIAEYAAHYAKVNPHLRDFNNLQPETVKRVNEKIAANLKPIPIEEAVNNLTRHGGWTPSDVKFLSETTVDEFYDYFVSSKDAAPSTIKELRSRLYHNEESKAVLSRIDEALRRIAKRSKLDEARVRQTDVTLP